MVDKKNPQRNRFARKIDTLIAPPLTKLFNEGTNNQLSEAINAMLKQLAQRNLIRGYLLSLPTGQAVAAKLGVPVLTRDELENGSSDEKGADRWRVL